MEGYIVKNIFKKNISKLLLGLLLLATTESVIYGMKRDREDQDKDPVKTFLDAPAGKKPTPEKEDAKRVHSEVSKTVSDKDPSLDHPYAKKQEPLREWEKFNFYEFYKTLF